MNYDTTPTPSFKPQPSNSSVSSRKYYPQENKESWAVTAPTESSKSNNNNSSSNNNNNNNNNISPIDDEMQQRQ